VTALRRLVLVAPPGTDVVSAELLAGLAAAARAAGVDATIVPAPPAGDAPGEVCVVVPHTLPADAPWPARALALSTSHPGLPTHSHDVIGAQRCAAALDLHPAGVTELRVAGVDAELLRPAPVAPADGDAGERDLDVLFVGTLNRRRDRLLASYASTLWRRRSALVVRSHEPTATPGPDVLAGGARRALLRRAKVVVIPRRHEAPDFPWRRAAEAIAAGCVVVCDGGLGADPFVAGEHFVVGAGESLGLLADGLLREPERLAALRAAARDALATAPLGVEPLLSAAEAVAAAPVPASARAAPGAPAAEPAAGAAEAPDVVRPVVKRLALQDIALRRRVDALEARVAGAPDPTRPEVLYTAPAHAAATPRVSVCIPCFDHADHVGAAIASIAAQRGEAGALELLVLDDGSRDASREVAAEALAARPWLPAQLLGLRVNAGLPSGRNALARAARGELVLMLDADNTLYPTAVERLVAALDADEGALFAYPVLEGHLGGEPVELLSYRAWDPALLRERNVVDALALLRRDRLLALGGYDEDLRLYGWEDYELWVRAAERGERGVHVPEVLARYRRGGGSMLSVTDIDTTEMTDLLRQRYPRTMGSLQPA